MSVFFLETSISKQVFGDILRNVYRHYLEYNIPSILHVPRITITLPLHRLNKVNQGKEGVF